VDRRGELLCQRLDLLACLLGASCVVVTLRLREVLAQLRQAAAIGCLGALEQLCEAHQSVNRNVTGLPAIGWGHTILAACSGTRSTGRTVLGERGKWLWSGTSTLGRAIFLPHVGSPHPSNSAALT